VLAPFISKDITQNILSEARQKKIAKYESIVKEVKELLESNTDDIRIKHKVSSVNVKAKFVTISNLEVVSKETERDVCDIVNSDKKERLRYECM
jgi:myosin-crossreactive antigen